MLCYQLLTGYLPFDDTKNPKHPALSKVWKAILTEDPPFRGSAWKEISQEAQDFTRWLLNKCAQLWNRGRQLHAASPQAFAPRWPASFSQCSKSRQYNAKECRSGHKGRDR